MGILGPSADIFPQPGTAQGEAPAGDVDQVYELAPASAVNRAARKDSLYIPEGFYYHSRREGDADDINPDAEGPTSEGSLGRGPGATDGHSPVHRQRP